MQMPIQPPGVPNPWAVHVHPYPTRFHGGRWGRPEFGYPVVNRPTNIDRPTHLRGLGEVQYQVGDGVFRYPSSGGGGVFNRAISGAVGEPSEGARIAAFVGALVVAAGGTYLLLSYRQKASRRA